MNPKTTLPTALASALVLATSADAATLFGDDFESYEPDTVLDESGPWDDVSPFPSFLVRDENTAMPFGTPNRYFEYNDPSNTSSVKVFSPDTAAASGALTTLSFDFHEPTSAVADGGFIIGYANQGADLNGAGSRARVTLDDGTISGLSTTVANTYSLDTSYRIFLIFNDTAESINYDGGTIASGVADVWIQALDGGAPVYVGDRSATNSQTASYRVGFRTFSTTIQQMLVDNVSLDEGAVLTELASDTPAITDIAISPTGEVVTLTWLSSPSDMFTVNYSSDLIDWTGDFDDMILADPGTTTTKSFDISGLDEESGKLFFRIERN